MNFTLSVNKKKIKALFKFPCDYIDVFVDKDKALLFAENTDIFVVAILPVNTINDYDKSILFRIPKEGFLSLAEDGIISFLCVDNLVYIKFETGKTTAMMKFDMQICSIQSVSEKIKILSEASHYPIFPIKDLILPSKLLSTSQNPITIEDGYAFATVGSLQLYAKTKCSNCAVFSGTMNFLISNCDNFNFVYDVRNYIIYSDGLYHVMINKAVSMKNSDIDFILKQKVIYKTIVNFENALNLLSRVKKYVEVDLNLRKQELNLIFNGCEYSAKVSLSQEEEKVNLDTISIESLLNTSIKQVPVINFPAEVFRNIIYGTKTKILKISVTKTLIRIYVAKELMFVCKRSDTIL